MNQGFFSSPRVWRLIARQSQHWFGPKISPCSNEPIKSSLMPNAIRRMCVTQLAESNTRHDLNCVWRIIALNGWKNESLKPWGKSQHVEKNNIASPYQCHPSVERLIVTAGSVATTRSTTKIESISTCYRHRVSSHPEDVLHSNREVTDREQERHHDTRLAIVSEKFVSDAIIERSIIVSFDDVKYRTHEQRDQVSLGKWSMIVARIKNSISTTYLHGSWHRYRNLLPRSPHGFLHRTRSFVVVLLSFLSRCYTHRLIFSGFLLTSSLSNLAMEKHTLPTREFLEIFFDIVQTRREFAPKGVPIIIVIFHIVVL